MGNAASNYAIIRVTPTLSTDAYAQGDVLFTATAIPNAVRGNAGSSLLLAMYLVNQVTTEVDIDFIFSEGNTALGTINATADIDDTEIQALSVTGLMTLDGSASKTTQLDVCNITKVHNVDGTVDAATPMLLQAAAGTTSVYVQGILTGSATPTYTADAIDLIFHIQYQ